MKRKSLKALCAAALCAAYVWVPSGCSDEDAQTLKTNFKASFECEYRGLAITGSITGCGEKLVTISIDAPETLEGLTVEYRGGEVDFSRDSLLCTADEAYLPQACFPSLTKQIFAAIQSGGAVYEGKSDSLDAYTLTLPQGTAHVTADENGFVSTASIDGEDYLLTLFDASQI